MEKSKKASSVFLIIWIVFAAISKLCLVAAWLIPGFSDNYRNYLFLKIQPVTSAISGALPFSAGEIGIYILVFGGLGMIVSYIILMIIKKGKRKKISKIYGCIIAWILLFIFFTETFNCFIMYHCRSFAEEYGISQEQYTREQLCTTAKEIALKCNEAAENVERGEDGKMIFRADVNLQSEKALHKISADYDTLGGYYPKMKRIASDEMMTKMDLLGIYFPFSMEANYNPKMYPSALPVTACHELAHLKGWIKEDEANFIAYLACVNSDDADFVYSGYFSAVCYLRNAVYNNCSREELDEIDALLSDKVKLDLHYYSDVFAQAQKDKISSSISSASKQATEANLKLNGVKEGIQSYGKFVDLLLNYYKK